MMIQGCGDENGIIEVNLTKNIDHIEEGMRADFPLNVNTNETFDVSLEQISGDTKAYVEYVPYNNEVRFYAPSVIQAEEIKINIKVRTESGHLGETSISVIVDPIELPLLTTLPEPNVFSSGNVAKHNYKSFDANGIPLTDRAEGQFYYPVSIASYAYDLYNYYYRTKDQTTLVTFLNVATWLRDNCVYTEYGFCSYRANFPIEAYQLTSDWTTSMGQGQAITSLIAAHYLTGDDSFGEVAKDAVSAYLYPIEVKGLSANFEGETWYEEYGSESLRSFVFNGAFFALSGVRDFIKNYDTLTANQVFNIGTQGIVNNLEHFDFNFTSRYDYSPLQQLASTKKGPDAYHELHIFQVGWLYNVTGIEKLKKFSHQLLKQDMAGIKLINTDVYNRSIEIKAIEASDTYDAEKLGVSKTIDGYWTYRQYWASYAEPVDLILTLNDDILESGQLERIVLTSVTEADMPESFNVIEIDEQGGEKILKTDVKIEDFTNTQYSHETGGYLSFTMVFDVFVPVTSNRIILRFSKAKQGLIKLREVDVQYPRPTLLDDLISRYQ